MALGSDSADGAAEGNVDGAALTPAFVPAAFDISKDCECGSPTIRAKV